METRLALKTQDNKPFVPGLRAAPDVLGRIGTLEVRLARSIEEIEAAQRLRYRVFFEEMGARMALSTDVLDRDHIDTYCDHLIVIDTSRAGPVVDRIVGTYRLLRHEAALRHDGFYSRGEYNVDALVARHPGKIFMELGRSCVLPAWRSRRTLEALWQGNWAYALRHGVDVMFGCASFPGARPQRHAMALTFLHNHARAEGAWAVDAVAGRGVSCDMMPCEAVNPREALLGMPPLIKGYLRLGARMSADAVADIAFGTTDILVVLPVSAISSRYIGYYGADAARFSA